MHLLDLKNLISGPASDIQSVSTHLERSDELSCIHTVVPSGFENPDALLVGGARVPLVVRRVDARQERDVHAEGEFRKLVSLTNRQPQSLRRRLGERGENTCVVLVSDEYSCVQSREIEGHGKRAPKLEYRQR